MSTTVDPRIAILSALNDPPYNQVAERRCVPWDEAEEKLNAYRAAIIDEVVAALQERAGELSELAEEEMRRDLEEQAQEWHRAAEVAAKLKRTKPQE
jgi:acyl-CoA reductase-like NAD-dependent aldehyde dehydrogenase